MKNNILSVFVIFILVSCQNKEKTDSKNLIKTIAQDTLTKTVAGTADLSEVPPKDEKAIQMIRKQLQILLAKDSSIIAKSQRFFYYDAFDLNNDKKNEYFVGFSGSYFCNTKGCSGYILTNNGNVLNSFSATDFPIYVTKSSTEKFQDLIMKSGNTFHHLKMKNKKYPSDPSSEEKWTGTIPVKFPALLNIAAQKYEKYPF